MGVLTDIFSDDYTEEERRGVNKFLGRRAAFGCFGVILGLLVMIGFWSCEMAVVCTRSKIEGTWVAAEDYSNGFDDDDNFIEFRYEGVRRDEKGVVLYMNGSKKGEVRLKEGRRAVETRQTGMLASPNREITIWITVSDDKVTLEYTDYSRPFYQTDGGGMYWGRETATEITETYVRISEDTGLSEEQRDALY